MWNYFVIITAFCYLAINGAHCRDNSNENAACLEKSEDYYFISQTVVTYYLSIFSGCIVVASIVYFLQLKQNKSIYVVDTCSAIKAYFKLLYRLRYTYGSIFTLLFDQTSDIAVIVQFAFLSIAERNYNKNNNGDDLCLNINMTYIFSASITILIFHRFYSTYLIFHISRRDYFLSFNHICCCVVFFSAVQSESDTRV